MRIFALAIGITCIAGAPAYGADILEQGKVRVVDTSTIEFSGIIGPTSASDFASKLTSSIDTVIITSEGGVTGEAIAIGELIQARRLKVIVRGYCISSCANYVFVGADRRVVEPDSVVAWHGGHSNNPFGRTNLNQTDLPGRRDLLRREQLLYLRAGVSIDLIVYSGLLTLGVATEQSREISAFGSNFSAPVAKREFTNWAPTTDVLKKLGMNDVSQIWHAGAAKDVEQVLAKHGFEGERVYVDAPYSYVPTLLRRAEGAVR